VDNLRTLTYCNGLVTKPVHPFQDLDTVLLSLALLYIDPVSGSIVLQALVAGLVGGMAFFRRSIARAFRGVLGRSSSDKDSTSA
jgi:hypothetical protein